jgi:hypothetical protein
MDTYWWACAALGLAGTVLLALGTTHGREWPARAYEFVAMVVLAWAIVLSAGRGLVELIGWVTS